MSGIYDIMGYEDDELLGDELDELLGQGTVDDFDEGGLLGAKRRAKRAEQSADWQGVVTAATVECLCPLGQWQSRLVVVSVTS
jgi:hypothetical protein